MANRQIIGIGAVVIGIALAAVLGVRSANSWLSRSASSEASPDIISASPNAIDSEPSITDSERDRNSSNDQLVSQANDADSTQPLSPLEEAGTYIQRQKRVEQDAAIANTPVEVIPTASSNTVAADNNTAAQSNTAVDPQPTAPEPVSATAPTPTAPAVSDPVPALW